MQINQRQLRLECLDYGMKRIANALGLKPNTVTIKLKDPTNNLYVNEFLAICNLLTETPEKARDLAFTLIQEGDL